MLFMSQGFKSLGYRVLLFNYPTTRYSPEVLEKLKILVDAEIGKTPKLYLVGHSMGGLVGRLFFQQYGEFMKQNFKDTALITLGTPHQKSHLGQYISQTPLKPLLGSSGEAGITQDIAAWKNETYLGCIAGVYSIGWNTVAHKFHKKKDKSDGTVFVEEASVSNATDSIVISCSHTGLVYSKEVVELAHYFILHKYFPADKKNHSF